MLKGRVQVRRGEVTQPLRVAQVGARTLGRVRWSGLAFHGCGRRRCRRWRNEAQLLRFGRIRQQPGTVVVAAVQANYFFQSLTKRWPVMNELTEKGKGTMAELLVAYELEARGYIVSQPFGERGAYDLVVDCNGVLVRIQVKSAHVPRAPRNEREKLRTVYAINMGSGHRYHEAAVDFIIGVVLCKPVPVFIIAPIGFVSTSTALIYEPGRSDFGAGLLVGAWDLLETFAAHPPKKRTRTQPAESDAHRLCNSVMG
jgi:hypothetical protein